ncbi:MAG: PspC domain-containing protein [Methanospirillum sp.]|nr:PspC domain-containing protein [Methanospirillum sp.]
MEPKKLYRARKDKILGGVCGGFGHYMDIDPVLVRILFILLILVWGAGILIYLIAWIIIPLEPEEADYEVHPQS